MSVKTSLMTASRLLLILIVSYIGVAVVINLPFFDESPLPQVEKIIQTQTSELNNEQANDNAYLALLGLKHAQDSSATELGKQVLQNYLIARENSLNIGQVENYNPGSHEKYLSIESWSDSFANCVDRTEHICFKQDAVAVSQLDVDAESLNRLLTRYQDIVKMKRFRETRMVAFNMPSPHYALMARLGKIWILQAYNQQDYEQVLSRIADDHQFWRRVLNQAESLIAKMVATARIWSQIEYLSELVSEGNLTTQQKLQAQNMISQLTDKELSLKEAFDWEFRHTIAFMQSVPFNYRLLSQFNATLNLQYQVVHAPLQCLFSLPEPQFIAFYQSYRKDEKPNICGIHWKENHHSGNPLKVYNIFGKMDTPQSSNIGLSDYYARLIDLDAMITLLKLKVELQSLKNTDLVLNKLAEYSKEFGKKFYMADSELGVDCLSKGVGKGSMCKLSL